MPRYDKLRHTSGDIVKPLHTNGNIYGRVIRTFFCHNKSCAIIERGICNDCPRYAIEIEIIKEGTPRYKSLCACEGPVVAKIPINKGQIEDE